jgi:Flp pilus assembly protein TadD
MPSGEDLHHQARHAGNRGAFGLAVRLLDRAESATHDPDLSTRIELTRAYVDSETGRTGSALDRCLSLLDRDDLLPETRGLVWAQCGLLRMRSGDGSEAMAAFDEAVSLLPPHLHSDIGLVHLNRGNVYLQQGEAASAASEFLRAREEFAHTDLEVQQAKAEHNLGYARLLTGDLIGALQMMDEAASVLSVQSAASRAVGEQDRAEVMTAAGHP